MKQNLYRWKISRCFVMPADADCGSGVMVEAGSPQSG
jgi:hypothetical protein